MERSDADAAGGGGGMKIKAKITENEFFDLVGEPPTDDDLDRVNCEKAGEIGHQSCGWNYKYGCPMFQRGDE